MKRIFVAIDISDSARARVADYIGRLRRAYPRLRVGWERPEKLHLTLKFLGEVGDPKLPDVAEAVARSAKRFREFYAAIAGTGVFPPRGDPRILWLGVLDGGKMGQVADELEREFEKIGFDAEKRKFHAHLTIARLREPRDSVRLAADHIVNEFEPVGFEAREIFVYESELQPTGSSYRKLAAYPFGKD